MFKKCVVNICTVFLSIDLFLLKVVCLIEVSPKLMQEKTAKPAFDMLYLQCALIKDQ